MGVSSPRNVDRVWGWVRFDPAKIDVDRILEVMGETLEARLAQPVVRITPDEGSAGVRVYRNPHLQARVDLVEGKIRVEVVPRPKTVLLDVAVRPWGAERLAFAGKIDVREAFLVTVPADVTWLDLSYRPLPDPYRPTPEERVTHHVRLEVPAGN